MDSMAKVGRVIAVAGSLETLLELHGARGIGLREKTESLRDRLPPEALTLSRRVGMVRNRVAHEPETEISDDELLQYEETARELARLIEGVETASESALPLEKDGTESLPQDVLAEAAEESDEEPESADFPAPSRRRHENSKIQPPFRLPRQLWALVPGVHLAVLLGKFLQALLPGWWYQILLLTLPLGVGTGWYYFQNREQLPHWWFWLAVGWFAAGWFGSVLTALAEKEVHPKLGKTALVPGLHVVYLLVRIGQNIRCALLLAALTGLAAQAAAVWLVCQAEPEWPIAAALTGASLLAAFFLLYL